MVFVIRLIFENLEKSFTLSVFSFAFVKILLLLKHLALKQKMLAEAYKSFSLKMAELPRVIPYIIYVIENTI